MEESSSRGDSYTLCNFFVFLSDKRRIDTQRGNNREDKWKRRSCEKEIEEEKHCGEIATEAKQEK